MLKLQIYIVARIPLDNIPVSPESKRLEPSIFNHESIINNDPNWFNSMLKCSSYDDLV